MLIALTLNKLVLPCRVHLYTWPPDARLTRRLPNCQVCYDVLVFETTIKLLISFLLDEASQITHVPFA